MNPATNTCDRIVVAPATGDTSATTTAWIDTLGYDYAQVILTLATGVTTASTFSALSIGEAETTSATSVSDIAGLDGSTSTAATTGFVIPKNVTTSGTVVGSLLRLNIDTRSRKRYLRLSATPGTTNIWGASLRLSRGGIEPPAATAGNVTVDVTA